MISRKKLLLLMEIQISNRPKYSHVIREKINEFVTVNTNRRFDVHSFNRFTKNQSAV